VNSLHWGMSPADALTKIGECREWLFDHRCVRHAVVVTPGLRQAIHANYAATLTHEALQYFNALDSACAWLTSSGFPISTSEFPHYEFIEKNSDAYD
jgi:hypothetical protein